MRSEETSIGARVRVGESGLRSELRGLTGTISAGNFKEPYVDPSSTHPISPSGILPRRVAHGWQAFVTPTQSLD